jgi:hypothetical protein
MRRKLNQDIWDERLKTLISELNSGIEFHNTSFKEIDAKAKYWLTVCLPGLLGIIGYSLQKETFDSPYMAVFLPAVGSCLFLVVFAFASTIIAETVRGGMVIPEDGRIESFIHFTQTKKLWQELRKLQASERLDALIKNESTNDKKSFRLKRAERLLFYGLPASACLAAGTALLDASSPQWWITTTTTRVGTGITVGTCAAAAAITLPSVFSHARNLVNKITSLR